MQEQKDLNNSLKILASGSLIFLIGIAISKIATYLYNVITVRTFGQEIYGIFSLTLMIAGIFLSFFSLGLQSGILRYVSFYRGKEEKEKIKYIFRFSLKFTLLISIIGGLLLFFLSDLISISIFHNSDLSMFIKLFAIFIPISLIAGIFNTILRSYEIIKWYSFIGNILVNLVQLSLLGILIFFNVRNLAIILSYNLGMLAMLISAFWVCKRKIPDIFNKPEINKEQGKILIKELLSYSWPIMFMGLVISFFSYIDSFSIGYFRTISEVGLYNVAVPISYLLQIVPLLFLQLFFPIITKEYSRKNNALIKNLSKQVSKWIFILNLPFLIIIILFPGAVIGFLFGSEYVAAANVLRFLSLGGFFYSIFSVSDNLLSMAGKSRISLFNFIITAIINIVLNIILVPSYGIEGAAFSAMISYLIWGILSFFTARHIVKISPLKKDMIKIFFVAVFSASLLLLLRNIFKLNRLIIIMLGIFFILLYFLLILLTKSFDENDIMILREIKKKIMPKKAK